MFLTLSVALGFLLLCSADHHHEHVMNVYPREEVTKNNTTEKWGYVTVRPKAHMFWWLYKTTNSQGYTNVPLVLWLQGGPGASSTGYGNFEEIGPLDANLQPRNTTWLQEVNLLFIDNPVGTGYSYVDDEDAYTTNVQEIADDLLSILKVFLQANSEFSTVPFYIFSESYGGKMTAAFSQVLYKAVKSGEVKCNFAGFAMGDSWISPIDSTNSWGTFLYVNSLIDRTQLAKLDETAKQIAKSAASGQWKQATSQWSALEDEIESCTDGVNFYNIEKWGASEGMKRLTGPAKQLTSLERAFQRHVAVYQTDDLAELMNGLIRKKLGCIPDNVQWGAQSNDVFAKQMGDFMKNVTDIVDWMVMNTPIKVVVYSGQLDLIVDNLGTEAWVYRLQIADLFYQANKTPIEMDNHPVAFVKMAKNFQYYYMLASGHMVPADSGSAALLMLKSVTKQSHRLL